MNISNILFLQFTLFLMLLQKNYEEQVDDFHNHAQFYKKMEQWYYTQKSQMFYLRTTNMKQ